MSESPLVEPSSSPLLPHSSEYIVELLHGRQAFIIIRIKSNQTVVVVFRAEEEQQHPNEFRCNQLQKSRESVRPRRDKTACTTVDGKKAYHLDTSSAEL